MYRQTSFHDRTTNILTQTLEIEYYGCGHFQRPTTLVGTPAMVHKLLNQMPPTFLNTKLLEA
jgi:hypothetical protein